MIKPLGFAHDLTSQEVRFMRCNFSLSVSLIMITLLGCTQSIFANTSDLLEPPFIQYPRDLCHALRRNDGPLLSNAANNYDSIQSYWKWDILCIGDNLVIDAPIRTNGGDVIFFANTISIKTPVDTRVYISPEEYSHFQSGLARYGYTFPPGDASNSYKRSPLLRNLYADYYSKSPDKIFILDKNYLPEAPSGLTPPADSDSCEDRATDSPFFVPTSPPDNLINRSVIQSGSIYIYTNKIEVPIDHENKNSVLLSDPLLCTEPNFKKGSLLIATGARGGRGGAGDWKGVFGNTSSQAGNITFSCGESAYQQRGNKNANGGAGFDAGNIVLNIVGRNLSEEERVSLVSISDVAGGHGGSNQALYTPSERGPSAAVSSDACAFIKNNTWPPLEAGHNGLVSIKALSSTNAVLEFARHVSSMDSRLDYDNNELVSRSILDKSVRAASFQSFSERRFYDILISSQLEMTDELLNAIASGHPVAPFLGLDVIEGLDSSSLLQSSFSVDAGQPLRQLTLFNRVKGNSALWSFLYRSGGLFNIQSKQVDERLSHLANQSGNAAEKLTLEEISKKLSELLLVENDIRKILGTKNYEDKLGALQNQLINLQKVSTVELIGNVKDAVEGVVLLIGSAKKGDYKQAAVQTEKVRNAINSINSLGNNVNEKNIKAQIDSVLASYDTFLRYVSSERSRYERERSNAIAKVFDARSSYGELSQLRTLVFGDLLRMVVIGYFLDPAHSDLELQQNIAGIGKLLKEFPKAVSPTLTVRDYINTCNDSSPVLDGGCIILPPSASLRVVTINSPNHWYHGLPAWVLAPSTQTLRLPTFGTKLDTISVTQDIPNSSRPLLDTSEEVKGIKYLRKIQK